MPKIAMIGAGSVIFCKTLMMDIMATEELRDSEFALMSPTETKLRKMEAFANDVIRENKLPSKVWATTGPLSIESRKLAPRSALRST